MQKLNSKGDHLLSHEFERDLWNRLIIYSDCGDLAKCKKNEVTTFDKCCHWFVDEQSLFTKNQIAVKDVGSGIWCDSVM